MSHFCSYSYVSIKPRASFIFRSASSIFIFEFAHEYCIRWYINIGESCSVILIKSLNSNYFSTKYANGIMTIHRRNDFIYPVNQVPCAKLRANVGFLGICDINWMLTYVGTVKSNHRMQTVTVPLSKRNLSIGFKT